MNAKSKSELLVIDEILSIARIVKQHLNEKNCNHNIKTIVNEALNKEAGRRTQHPEHYDTDTNPIMTNNG